MTFPSVQDMRQYAEKPAKDNVTKKYKEICLGIYFEEGMEGEHKYSYTIYTDNSVNPQQKQKLYDEYAW